MILNNTNLIKQHKCDVEDSESTHIESENGMFEQHGTNQVKREQ